MAVRIEIDYERCTGCGACVRACRFGTLEWLDEPIVVDPNLCKVCRDCEKACEVKAIKVFES